MCHRWLAGLPWRRRRGSASRYPSPPSSALCLDRSWVLPRPACDWRRGVCPGEDGAGVRASDSYLAARRCMLQAKVAWRRRIDRRFLQSRPAGLRASCRPRNRNQLAAADLRYQFSLSLLHLLHLPSAAATFWIRQSQPPITGATSPDGPPAALGRRSRPVSVLLGSHLPNSSKGRKRLRRQSRDEMEIKVPACCYFPCSHGGPARNQRRARLGKRHLQNPPTGGRLWMESGRTGDNRTTCGRATPLNRSRSICASVRGTLSRYFCHVRASGMAGWRKEV